MIVRIVPIAPVVSNDVQSRSGRLYGNITQTIANDPGDLDDLDRPDRSEFYPDDRGRLKVGSHIIVSIVSIAAVTSKSSLTIGTII